ncbi:MAG: sensor histidine kinase [Lachnospiraceae bacterium]|nr:sensor histidine kinase [Lachnospiraceae bacterium]
MRITKKIKRVKNIKNSLSFKLSMVFVGIAGVLILSSMIFIFVIVNRERKEYAEREAENVLVTLSASIRSDIDYYRNVSRLIEYDARVKEFLKAPSSEIMRSITYSETARIGTQDYLNITEGVDSVFIFRKDLQFMTTLVNRSDYRFDYARQVQPDWLDPLIELKGGAFLSLNGNGVIHKSDGKTLLSISRAVYDNVSQKHTGYMFMNITSSFLEDEISQLRPDDICVLTTDGIYLAGNNELAKYLEGFNIAEDITHRNISVPGTKLMLSAIKLEGLPIVLLYAVREERHLLPMELLYVIILLPLIYFICVFLAGIFIRKNITSPVFELTSEINKNSKGDSLVRIEREFPKNEIGMIKDTYNNMVTHTQELWNRLLENEQTLQSSQMRVLQEQIKPHFLYNSLETIGYLAVDAGAEKVHSALETLGSFYRNFLSKGDREIPLKRELMIIKDYLSLQKLRYGDILNDEYDIAPDTEECLIPKLILQPLVENSIYHGIRMKGEKGTIKISSWLKDKELHITVRDTGIGMTDEQIEKVLSTEKTDNTDEDGISASGLGSSFGLWGTIERIRCYCNKDDVVKITSEPGEYTEVEIIINTDTKNWRTVNVQSNADR